MTSRFLELLLAAILDGRCRGAGRIIQKRPDYLTKTLNCFSFAGSYYKQITGVAMGTKMGPSYANLLLKCSELSKAPNLLITHA